MKNFRVLLGMAILAVAGANADAGCTLSFVNGSNNSGVAGVLKDQFSVEFSADGNNAVLAKISQSFGSYSSSVKSILFEDADDIFSSASIYDESDGLVDYNMSKKVNLPGWNNYFDGKAAKDSYGFEAAKPSPKKGIGAGESLTIRFTGYGTSDDLYAELCASSLRIGLHAQSIKIGCKDYSDSFFAEMTEQPIESPLPYPVAVPAPAAVLLASAGSFMVAGLRRLNK